MKKILFLDVNESELEDYKQLANVFDIDVYLAKNAVEAHRLIDGNHFDLIVSDYYLQEENGIDFLSGVREYDQDVPMIMVGENDDEDILGRAALNMHLIEEYFHKPVRVNDLNKVMNRIPKQR